jgi:inhibitor of KinA sporulation pathway (predicted exonuclease)|tara:strand:+ start:3331 stop:3564 length:234 start_codon:yes stop_codon:yes gene_type:complete
MTINTSNIKLQITRGKQMLKGKQKNIDKAAPFGKITEADFKKLRKRKGGGMTYQLYGGSTKDFSDGNKFIQSFYDKE